MGSQKNHLSYITYVIGIQNWSWPININDIQKNHLS